MNSQQIKDIESQIIEEFSIFEDWADKYSYIIELADTLPIIDDSHRNDNYLIKGCQSRVWTDASFDPNSGVVEYRADSDAIITKGIVALLVRVLSSQKPSDIVGADMDFIDTIGLSDHLSPTRANGLVEMIKRMKQFAASFSEIK